MNNINEDTLAIMKRDAGYKAIIKETDEWKELIREEKEAWEKLHASEKEASGEKNDHIDEELNCIAGVLDMIFLINKADAWDDRGEEIGFVIMDARDRAIQLIEFVLG